MADSHVNGTQETRRGSTESQPGELDEGFQQLYNHVYLCGVESIPQANPSTSTSDWFRPVSSPVQDTNLGNNQHASVSADQMTGSQAEPYSTTDSGAQVSLGRLWEEPGLDIDSFSPTFDDDDESVTERQEHDGLAATATGPDCSVCGEPLRWEALISGGNCEVCHFI